MKSTKKLTIGLYPVNPASGKYMFGSPSVDEVEIKLAHGKFIIRAENNSRKNIYIQSVGLKWKPYSQNYILHQDLMKEGILVFKMGDKPKKQVEN